MDWNHLNHGIKYLTLNDMQKAMGTQSLRRTESIFGTWTSRISKGPDADWILCSTYCKITNQNIKWGEVILAQLIFNSVIFSRSDHRWCTKWHGVPKYRGLNCWTAFEHWKQYTTLIQWILSAIAIAIEEIIGRIKKVSIHHIHWRNILAHPFLWVLCRTSNCAFSNVPISPSLSLQEAKWMMSQNISMCIWILDFIYIDIKI